MALRFRALIGPTVVRSAVETVVATWHDSKGNQVGERSTFCPLIHQAKAAM